MLNNVLFFPISSVNDEDFTETNIIIYLEEKGFQVCWHQRDFRAGTRIAENIADATVYSRRIIFILSRHCA